VEIFNAHDLTDWQKKIITGAIRVILKKTRMMVMVIIIIIFIKIMYLQRSVNAVARRFAHPNV
jgi:hypothetical protein